MASVAELTASYETFMLGPRHGPGVCRRCLNFTRGYHHCFACTQCDGWLDAVVPISYSVGREQLHHALSAYKRLPPEIARPIALGLGAVLWRFLSRHEKCIASLTGGTSFPVVTTVPAGTRARDERQPLRWLVGEVVRPVRARHQRLLARSGHDVAGRAFDPRKFEPLRRLHGEAVLLVDDTWTTGANAQSAAAALKSAGAGAVAVVVIGRHLNREWHENDRRLRGIARPFDWTLCAACAGSRNNGDQPGVQ